MLRRTFSLACVDEKHRVHTAFARRCRTARVELRCGRGRDGMRRGRERLHNFCVGRERFDCLSGRPALKRVFTARSRTRRATARAHNSPAALRALNHRTDELKMLLPSPRLGHVLATLRPYTWSSASARRPLHRHRQIRPVSQRSDLPSAWLDGRLQRLLADIPVGAIVVSQPMHGCRALRIAHSRNRSRENSRLPLCGVGRADDASGRAGRPPTTIGGRRRA